MPVTSKIVRHTLRGPFSIKNRTEVQLRFLANERCLQRDDYQIRLTLVNDNDSCNGRTLVRLADLKVGHYTSRAMEKKDVPFPTEPESLIKQESAQGMRFRVKLRTDYPLGPVIQGEESLGSRNFAFRVFSFVRPFRFSRTAGPDRTVRACTALEAGAFGRGSLFCRKTLH
jgi:hypothetical protein